MEEGKGSPRSPRSTLSQAASPDVHLMGAEAEVGVQDKAGGKVVILTQLSGCHSVRSHGAPRTMLPLAQTGGRNEGAGAAPRDSHF